MAAPPAPLPPQVMEQQNPQQQQSVFMQQGLSPQPGMQAIQQASWKLQELERWLEETIGILRQVAPGLIPHLAPMAQAGKELRGGLMEIAQRSGMAQGSPVMPQVQQTNPAAGPPNPMAF